ncbi:unnamed protein product [Brassica oleracea var. botrytis]
MLKDEKPGGGTVHRRNLHPRKPVVVICNDESSSGDGGTEGPPQTGGHLGVPKATISKSRKRKANEDNHGQSESQISGDGNDASEVATKGDTPTLFEREKCFENEYHNTRSPPFDENIADEGMSTPNAAEDCLQPEKSGTAVTALFVYSNVLLVRSQSYVSPPKSTLTRRYRDEESVPVAWEERNPNLHNSVKTVHASHPASSTYPESEPKVASTGNKDVGEPVLVEENLERVPSPVVEGGPHEPPLGEERKPCSLTEEDEKYDSCKEDISNDSQLQEKETQPKRGHPLSDTDDDSNDVESDGKRQRKKSNKIRGVYTPEARLKGLFSSEKKVEYKPIGKTSRAVFNRKFEIKTGTVVMNSFFLNIAEPEKWLSDERYYSWSSVVGIYQNGRTVDCGTCAAKFIEMHANGDDKEEMSLITDKIVDRFREKYAMDCYEEFVGDFRVPNKGSMK